MAERGIAYRELGQLDDAETDLQAAVRISEELGERQLASWTWRALARVSQKRGNRAEAEERLRRAKRKKPAARSSEVRSLGLGAMSAQPLGIERPVPARLPPRAGRPHAGLVHAAGGPLPARVPGAARGAATSSSRAGRRTWPSRSRCSRSAAWPLDAAILFSDIMVPLAAMGVDVRIEAGVGPVVDRPIRSAADVGTAARRSSPRRRRAVRARGHPAAAQGADGAADRVRRRAVHAGELPGRGWTVAEPRADEGADATPTRRRGAR